MSTDTAIGRVWLITGSSSGFGRAFATAALAAGDTVVATARKTDSLADLVAGQGDRALALPLDVTDAGQIDTVVAEVLDRFGRIDVLVNNAGRALVGAVEETTDDELRALMELHFFGPAALTRAVLPGMRERRTGAIVQITSMGGRYSFPAVSAYSATKFALEGLSESLAAEVAPFGIRVLIVEPGSFRTGLAGGGSRSKSIEAYAEIVGAFDDGFTGGLGDEPGDPAKAAAAIITAIEADDPPVRLVLGNDAADLVAGRLDAELAEFRAWEHLTRGTDFDA